MRVTRKLQGQAGQAGEQAAAAETVPVPVIVVKAWSGGPLGAREPGDRFDYDLERDPHGVAALGLVKAAPAEEPAAGEQQEPAA